MMKYIALVLLFVFSACAPKPTKVTTEMPVVSTDEKGQYHITENTIILDVRAPFDFNIGHIPGAINVAWEDFSRRPPDARGLLEKDLHPIVRRLALIGVEPGTPVLVVGKGRAGKGEEGRVAWTLAYLGVNNVHIAPVEAFRERVGTATALQNKKFWDAKVNSDLEITWNELRGKIRGDVAKPKKRPGKKKAAPALAPLPPKSEDYVLLDVRAPEEFSIDNMTKRTKLPVHLVNIEWKDFYGDDMQPDPSILKVLLQNGITDQTQIFVISTHGVRSGAVTWALRKLGYANARNFAGGYEQVNFKSK